MPFLRQTHLRANAATSYRFLIAVGMIAKGLGEVVMVLRYFAGLLTVVSAFLFTTESALAQKAHPSTLAKTVRVEKFGPRDTEAVTLLSVFPVEIKIPRHGAPKLPEMTLYFFAERPLRGISSLPVRIPGGVAAPTYASPNLAIGTDTRYSCKPEEFIGGASYPPKPEPNPPPRFGAGLHRCIWPLHPLFNAIYDPAKPTQPTYVEAKLKAGDRVGFLVSIWGADRIRKRRPIPS